jgi:tetratricopeptide (TPR) repeat protein
MKAKSITLFLIFLTILTPVLNGQEANINEEFKKSTIERMSMMINDFYVFPDVAKKSTEHLKKQYEKGFFNAHNDVKSFADALTKEVQSINNDKHMRIIPALARTRQADNEEGFINAHLKAGIKQETNGGFKEVKKLEGNIGYLDIRFFPPLNDAAPIADAYMKLLSNSDAIIIDLRKNGGGSPDMVNYLCSYFFDKKIHLNSIYKRRGDKTEEYWTKEHVNGRKLPEVPLFILSSNYTFSGAEEFSYNMQTQKRATLIGETTGGGANPGGVMLINEKLEIFIPDGKAINPVTGTNWEGKGVEPEIKTTATDAFDKALELAAKAAEDFRNKKITHQKDLLKELYANLKESKEGDNKIYNSLQKCVNAGFMSESDVNNLGYSFFRKRENNKAEEVLKANTLLFPNSANTYDSYAEALSMNNKKDKALKNYKKAVEVALAQKDPQLELFKRNYEQFQQINRK